MRKKLLSKTYLWESTEYNETFFISSEADYYASVKKIIKRNKPFIVSSGDRLIDNYYTIIEVIPKNEYYAMRVFLNEKKEILQYYFDISLGNGLDEETLIPYYDDLFLDVICTHDQIELIDGNELEEALQDGTINDAEFELAQTTAAKLMEEIRLGTNKYYNMNFKELFKI